jgi:serine protease Do
VKKFAFAIALVLLGASIGGIGFYTYQAKLGASRGFMRQPPRIPTEIRQTAMAFSDIVKAVTPSVVNISSTRGPGGTEEGDEMEEFFNPFDLEKKGTELSLGSGVIVSEDGYIVTNNHVVADSEEIKVTLLDKRTFQGELVGADPKTDLAIVKIDASGLPTAVWGDSDNLSVGEFVLAIGNPFSLNNTVTMGIVSAVGRANVGIADYEDFIQTDAAINPGNSGGPLVNIRGEIVGINTAIFSKSGGYQGIGFAVPVNMVRSIMDQLVKNGKVVRGWLGVSIQEMTPEVARKFGLDKPDGALVSDITKGSPAQKAGLKRGDIITEFNGKPVKDASSLKNLVAQSSPGAKAVIRVVRGSRSLDLNTEIGEYPTEISYSNINKAPRLAMHKHEQPFSGLKVADLSREVIRQLGLSPSEKGVVVVEVREGSPGDLAGLKRGDVIEEIDRKGLAGVADFNRMASRAPKEEPVLLLVNRSEKRFYISLDQD